MPRPRSAMRKIREVLRLTLAEGLSRRQVVEYKERAPDGYQYSQFCRHYRRWQRHLDVVMRQEHRAGEKLFVDFAGQTLPIVDPATGVISRAPAVRGRAGRQHLHLRRSGALAGAAALDRLPRARLRVLRRGPQDRGP
jgi:transposase